MLKATGKGAFCMEIRLAAHEEAAALSVLDKHVSLEILREKIAAGQVLLLLDGGRIAGWLRWSLFWDEIPFMNLLYLLEPYRGRGLGRRLVETWEAALRGAGYAQALTSTQADECAQHFYRRLGYADIGAFALPGEALELMLRKAL